MDIRQIVEKYLRKNKFDGLFSGWDCGCKIDDLMPCGEAPPECEPGYKMPCGNSCMLDGNCDWHIGLNKEQNAG